MSFKPQRTIAVAVLAAAWIALTACTAANKPPNPQEPTPPPPTPAQVSITDSNVAVTPRNELVLKITARLHNPTTQPINLFAGTPCAVFRWSVTAPQNNTNKTIQTKQNQPCAQIVATETLPPYSSIQTQYKITLNRTQYRHGKSYILNYQFWNHHGVHTFTITDAVTRD